MTEHTATRSTVLATLAVIFFASPAVADPLDAATPLPWSGQGQHLVCDVSVAPVDARLDARLDAAPGHRPEDTSVLAVKKHGWYWLYDGAPSTDGTLEQHESGRIRVADPSNPRGRSTERLFLGQFWLNAGPNAVTMHRACPLVPVGTCGIFDHGRPDTSCTGHSATLAYSGAADLWAVQTPQAP